MYVLCKELGCLPRSGGLMDQSPAVVNRFGVIRNVLIDVENSEVKKQEAISRYRSGS